MADNSQDFRIKQLQDEREGSEDLLDALDDFPEDVPQTNLDSFAIPSHPQKHAMHKSLESEILSHPLNTVSLAQFLTRDNSLSKSPKSTEAPFESEVLHEDSGSETLASTPSWCDTRSCSSQMVKRFQPSPTPSNASSSNASVIASEEEEEGFEDVDFPAQMGDLHFAGNQKESSGGVDSVNGMTELAEKMARFVDSAELEEDQLCGFNMPDDFSWEKSGIKGASLQLELGSFSPAIAQPKQPAGVSSNSTGGVNMLMSKPVKAMDFGDGTELDFLDDISEADSVPVPSQTPPLHPIPLKAWAEQPESLPSSPKIPVISQIPVIRNVSLTSKPAPKQETAIRKPAPTPARPALSGLLASSLRRSDTNLNRWTNSIPQPPPKKQKKKPTLIRNVNPADIAHVIGKMVYDPILQKWTGNEEALLDFDKESSGAPSAPPSPQKPRHRPALITNRSGLSHIPHVVGKMVFDPEKMCWVGNDEDADVFAGLEDAFGSSETDQDTQKYFTLTKAMKQSLYVAESSHKLFIGKWYPKAVQEAKTLTRDTSKSHLYDIRTMSVRL